MSIGIESEKLIGIKSGSFDPHDGGPGLQGSVCVLFTSTDQTLKALEKACELAKSFSGRVSVVATPIVPFPLPLDEPPIPSKFIIGRFAEQAGQFQANISILTYLCRDRLEALKRILPHNSIIIIGVRRKWWPTYDERLAQTLRRAGYAVLLLEAE